MNSQPTVFVVDDDAGVRGKICTLLTTADLRAEPFETAEEFIDSYREDGPACLILDVNLPGMTGLQLLRWMRALGSKLPIIVMNSEADDHLARRVVRWGASAYHIKRELADPELLLGCIRHAMHRSVEG